MTKKLLSKKKAEKRARLVKRLKNDRRFRASNSTLYRRIRALEKCAEQQRMVWERFVQRYALPASAWHAVEKINKRGGCISVGQRYVGRHYAEIVCKGNRIERLINAERMRQCIEENKLDRLDVQTHHVHRVGNELMVFAEYIPETKREIELKDIKQLAILAEKTGYVGWEKGGYTVSSLNDKITILNTENESFQDTKYSLNRLPRNCKARFCFNVRRLHDLEVLDQDAGDFYENRFKELKNLPEGIRPCLTIPDNAAFDPHGLKFKMIKNYCNKKFNKQLSHA